MTGITGSELLGMAFLFGLVIGLLLIAYDDGVPFDLYKRIKCRMGKHTFKIGYRKHINKYFCKHCKSPRKHPSLKAIEGGRRDLKIDYKL